MKKVAPIFREFLLSEIPSTYRAGFSAFDKVIVELDNALFIIRYRIAAKTSVTAIKTFCK